MESNTLTLSDVFTKDIRYVVPMFQRPYVWNEEEHWKLLWEDILQVVNEELDKQNEMSGKEAISQRDSENKASPHFLGAIVLDQKTNPIKKLETREVIDGQQRLITLQVFLSAAQEFAKENGFNKKSQIFKRLIYNDKVIIEEDKSLFKVWPIERDREAYRYLMETGNGKEQTSSEIEEHQIYQCYQYFLERLNEWAEGEEEPIGNLLEALETTIWHLIKLVVIDLDSNDDAQVIFETLNARGTPLLAADLIKNYSLREVIHTKQKTESLYENYWKEFDEDKWREEVSQGRLERPRIDVFIMHWLTMKTAKQVRAKKLFPSFKKYLDRTNDDIEDLLKDINHYANVYLGFSDSEREDRIGLFFNRLEVMDTTTPYPPLLWMFGNNSIPDEQKRTAVEVIESWLIRRMLCKLTTKNYNNIFIDLLEALKNSNPDETGQTVVEFFRSKEGESEYWPDNKKLKESIVELPYWGRINQRRLKMVFRALERELRKEGFSESREITETLHIEHILPREWAHNWSLPGIQPEEVERMERDKMKHTFGNLTVLTEKLNSSVSNASWDVKQEKIHDHSVLTLNKELIKKWPDRWNEETIKERGLELAKVVVEVWPEPDSSYWD
ncbi:DUF262 domain-containing HNH endonuclease family protein [Candidatus Bipolaricaulota bacterium]|nr:DUF262 domain-containing HNH endonuclease family protein [Candidatus Bipolaricaulota bacterium]